MEWKYQVCSEIENRFEGGDTRSFDWKWGPFKKWFENLVQWKLPKIHACDVNEVS